MGLATIRRRYRRLAQAAEEVQEAELKEVEMEEIENEQVEETQETQMVEEQSASIDYSKMTVDELKSELDDKNIEYNHKAKKQELIDLLAGDTHVAE